MGALASVTLLRGAVRTAAILVAVALILTSVRAQQPNGSIGGVVTDASGAVIVGAQVEIVHPATRFTVRLKTSKAGTYTAPALLPGDYEVRVFAPGFATGILRLRVEVGRTSTGDAQLAVGSSTDSMMVESYAVRVSASDAKLEGVVTPELILRLPLNGRNFLELGQLEPGAQINDGSTLMGGKPFFATLGVNGQSGVLNRITLDGVDITDEHFGGPIENISEDAIQEFQVSHSGVDISTGLTGSGAINVVSKSGANEVHGTGFVFWRDDTLAARIAEQPAPFDREHAGFSAGGPFRRDRLFWFANYEAVNQDGAVGTAIPEFPQFTGTWQIPFDERMGLGRLDYVPATGLRFFARFIYDWNQGIPTGRGNLFGGTSLSAPAMQNNAKQIAAGLDAVRGRFVHSLRFGYLNSDEQRKDGTALVPGLPATLDPAGRPLVIGFGGTGFGGFPQVGPNLNIPQHRYQDSYETRYDGGVLLGRHNVRWGALVNVIRTNWFEAVFSTPTIILNLTPATIAACEAAGRGSDPFCYPVKSATIGNGQGWFSEVPTQGQSFGGFKNTRIHWYLGDNWRATDRLQMSFGLRYVYEPGQDSPDLQPPAILASFDPAFAHPPRRDKNNFAPQIGLAWDPTGKGKWAIRASAGLFYDTKILKDNWWVRNNEIAGGISSLNVNLTTKPLRDPNTGAVIFNLAPWIGQPLGTPGLIDAVIIASQEYHQAYVTAAANYPSAPSNCEFNRGCQWFPDYRTPYVLQFNAGVQREIRPGLVLSVDYVRHRGLHHLVRRDANRQGAADTLNVANALAAIAATNAAFAGCAGTTPAAIQCAIDHGATIDTYAARGLGRNGSASSSGPSTSAFPGINPQFNNVVLHEMAGSSTYDALQVQVRGRMPELGHAIRNFSLVGSYSLGRLMGTTDDDALVFVSGDNLKKMYGPSTLDRTHMFSLATTFDAPGGVRISSLWRASTPLPQSVFVPESGSGPGEIFRTDFDGDGNTGDPLPGTRRGSYGRDIGCGGTALNRLIDGYNNMRAGQLTPAGEALVHAGLFTTQQLMNLHAVQPEVIRAPEGQVCLDGFMTADVRISRPIKIRRFTVEPALEWFNVFNVANFDLSTSRLNSVLTGLPGAINGTTTATRNNRAGFSGGSMSIGAPRSWQLALRVTF